MPHAPLPSVERLRELISYNAETGSLVWMPRCAADFLPSAGKSAEAKAGAFNTRYVGTPALSNTTIHGYRAGSLFGHRMYAHRVAWALHFGAWPDANIDHINGDGTDNRVSNLRDVSQSDNMSNRRRSGGANPRVGVRQTPSNKWSARIEKGGKTLRLGVFNTFEEAALVRNEAEIRLGFTSRHFS